MCSLVRKCYEQSPEFLRRIALAFIHKGRAFRYGLEMILFPNKMKGVCPCCDTKFRSFIDVTYLKNADIYNQSRYVNIEQAVFCPACRSLPRHRIFALWCNAHKDYLQTAKILYFAPEYSMMTWMRQHGISCVTADLYKRADLKLDIQSMDVPDSSYDMVICNHVLEHVDNYRVALKEVRRVLRPGGYFICSFPMDSKIEFVDEDSRVQTDAERLERFGQVDHKRVFGMKSERLLIEAGFKVKKISGERCPKIIKPVIGPADYDMNILFWCKK